jgi:poly-gamma-glutamate synthesis protein (capsule biosynthesis protein)
MTPFHLEPDPDTTAIESQIAACRKMGCDLVFVALHWGLEFEFFPHPHQRMWAHRFAEVGADMVIGHHPHVIQGVEIHRVPGDPERQVPILYSLGNLTPVLSHPATTLSMVARLRLVQGRLLGRARTVIAGLDLTPVLMVSSHRSPLVLARLDELAGGKHDRSMRAYVDEAVGYADLVLGTDWRIQD